MRTSDLIVRNVAFGVGVLSTVDIHPTSPSRHLRPQMLTAVNGYVASLS